MILHKKYRKMMKGAKYEFKCATNHWNLYIEGEYIYGFSMGDRISPINKRAIHGIKKKMKQLRKKNG